MATMGRVQLYLLGWRLRRPAGLVSREYLSLGVVDPLVRLHRRVFLGAGVNGPRLAWAPRQAWLLGRWYVGGWQAAVARISDERLTKLAPLIDVPVHVQRTRLIKLARDHAIPPDAALSLGLVCDGMPERWAEFAFDFETGWNAAASTPAGRSHIRMLGDKEATARILTSAGIQCVPSFKVLTQRDGADFEGLVETWLSEWPRVFGKRRTGSRGEGAFELWRLDSESGTQLREYQAPRAVADPLDWLRTNLAGHEYLIQPRLASHSMFDGLADPTDVVTVRAITRDLDLKTGTGPSLFCAWLEVPLAITGQQQFYLLLRLSDGGEITGVALPDWLRTGPDGDQNLDRIVESLKGRRVPDYPQLVDDAMKAHQQFPGMFAAGWDVAISTSGNLFLEGNGGFGVETPQRLAGGLLCGVNP